MDSRFYFSAVSIHDHSCRVAGTLLFIETPINRWRAAAQLTPQNGQATIRATMPDHLSRRIVLGGLLACVFLSGAAGLIYQVAWGKALGLVFGHTAYAL